jgi:magnesium chelatase family protein
MVIPREFRPRTGLRGNERVPCACWYYVTDRCTCSSREVSRYQQKISGPLLDRIDLQVIIKPLSTDDRFAQIADAESPSLRAVVEKARQLQNTRFEGTAITCNASIPGGAIPDYCGFSEGGFSEYKRRIESSTVTTRTVDRLARVARTIADLGSSRQIEDVHIDEAASFMLSFGQATI